MRTFENEINVRFTGIQRAVSDLVVRQDAFGLTTNTIFTFQSSAKQAESFRRWLQSQIQSKVLSDPNMTADDWWEKYVTRGYSKGFGRSFGDVRGSSMVNSKKDLFYSAKSEFTRLHFQKQTAKEAIQLLSGRTLNELEGVTNAMSQQMVRTLVDGLQRGHKVETIAKNLNGAVDGIGKTRARMIARTEIVRAHAEGQLDALQTLGIKEFRVNVEFTTNPSIKSGVCPKCQFLKYKVFTIETARGIIPVHPNCRCAWTPVHDVRAQRLTKQMKDMLNYA